ncbi:MAG: MFS transporter [Neisseriaceae bacterium]|nr:MFS transporter [Neisseriaceae bacterium]
MVNKQSYVVIALLSIALFMLQLDSTVLNTSLVNIANDLHVNPSYMQTVIISYVLTLAVFIPSSAILADRFGTRNILSFGILLFTLGSLMCALSPNLPTLVVSRIIQGVGGSFIMPITRISLIHFFDKRDLLKFNNYLLMPALIGQLSGPLIGGYISQLASWHWIFLINIPIGLLGFILTLLYLPNHVDRSYRSDLPGLIIFTLGTVTLSTGIQFYGKDELFFFSDQSSLLFMLAGVIFFIFYVFYAQKKTRCYFPFISF